jgi:hypothetical protein
VTDINDQFGNPIAVGDTVKITSLDSSGGAYLTISQATWTVVSLGRTRARLASSAWANEPTVVGRCLGIIETGDGRTLEHTPDSVWAARQKSLRG